MEETGGDVGDCIERLRAYDPRCSLVHNLCDERWEIWRVCEDTEVRRVGDLPGPKVPHGDLLVATLAQVDTWRGYDPVAAMEKAEADREKALDNAFDDQGEELADKLHFALRGDEAPGSRPMPLGG